MAIENPMMAQSVFPFVIPNANMERALLPTNVNVGMIMVDQIAV